MIQERGTQSPAFTIASFIVLTMAAEWENSGIGNEYGDGLPHFEID